ncbi:MAG: 30S ribosomal protein S27e [Euryarchaeota archaeon]|nr:30S ribosomal protein S27e [Euryarchaeota archaeon]MBE54231.1 30S ribosomal protein S27e [Euryarchaeota archaeon]DAC21196.1 MAG TPA: 30S ribosomal protein S27e [Candidatus Poseidoniales archaeon]HII78299.1 30S ribosomal protein S27e [Poseidonia sp.]
MTKLFFRVSCRDCGSESIIFSRATTSITCDVCSATMTKPAGGKADLVGCTVVEALN